MGWAETIPTIITGLAVLFIPGALLARVMGARGLTLLAASAPLSVSIAAAAAVVGQFLKIPWSPLFFAGMTVLVSIITGIVRYFWLYRVGQKRPSLEPGEFPPPMRAAAFGLALAIPATLIGLRFIQIIGSPEHFSQTYDNVFHTNALKFILDTGRASSLTLGSLDPTSSKLSMYPAAWHDVVALIIQASGSSIPVGINITNILIGGLVWPLSAMFLVSRISGQRVIPLLMTGALAAGFSSFPYLMIDFGVLFPNLLSIAILPFSLGALIAWLGLGRASMGGRHLSFWLLAASAIGLALSHPSTLMALIAFACLPVLAWLVRRLIHLKGAPHAARDSALAGAIVVAYLLIALLLWNSIRPTEQASFWPPPLTVSQAIGEFLTSAPQGRPTPWLIFILTIVGISVLARNRRDWWVIALFCVFGAFYAVVAGYPKGPLRSFLTGIWYNDSNRLAALLPVMALVIAATGGGWLVERLLQYLRTGSPAAWLRSRTTAAVVLVIVAVSSAVLTQGNSVGHAVAQAARTYESTPVSPLLSSDEQALLERLPEHVPDNSTVAGNPWTGASLSYAVGDRRAMLPAVGTYPTPEQRLILDKLNKVTVDPTVCKALKSQNTFFVLDFGEREVHKGKHSFPGMEGISTSPGFRLVDSQGEAKLYEVTACR